MELKTLLCSDKYQYTMGKSFVEAEMHKQTAIFNLYYRTAPEGNNWIVVSGINEVLQMVDEMGKYPASHYEKFLASSNLELRHDGLTVEDYCKLLSELTFEGTIEALPEGTIAFPNTPIIKVTAPLLIAQLLETPMLCIMNDQIASATKASRVTRATKKPISSFGSRRAKGPWSAMMLDKAAYIAGCSNGSNTLSKIDMNVPCTGTMAHSYVTAFAAKHGNGPKAEYYAFKNYIETHRGESLIMLIDTYDTLKSGIKMAIKAFKDCGITNDYPFFGVRLDSGDLAYLADECRKELDKAGYTKCKIGATNGLDEYSIRELESQTDNIDFYGVGDAIAVPKFNTGCVYKLVSLNETPVIKMSEDKIKITNPGNLYTLRLTDVETNKFIADVTCVYHDTTYNSLIKRDEIILTDQLDKTKQTKLEAKSYYAIILQEVVMENDLFKLENIETAKARYKNQLSRFDKSQVRLSKPHLYKNNISDELYNLKLELMHKIKDEMDDIDTIIQEINTKEGIVE